MQRYLQDYELELADKKEHRDEIFNEINRRRTQRAMIQERQSNFRRNYEEAKHHLQRLREKVDRGISQLTEIEHQINQATEELQVLRGKYSTLNKRSAALKMNLSEPKALRLSCRKSCAF